MGLSFLKGKSFSNYPFSGAMVGFMEFFFEGMNCHSVFFFLGGGSGKSSHDEKPTMVINE